MGHWNDGPGRVLYLKGGRREAPIMFFDFTINHVFQPLHADDVGMYVGYFLDASNNLYYVDAKGVVTLFASDRGVELFEPISDTHLLYGPLRPVRVTLSFRRAQARGW